MTRQFGLMCLAFSLVSVVSASESEAQLRAFDQIAQRPFRALGHGTGPGYHRCNPGPDSSYYNPWSQRNSFLVSRSPEYLSRFGYEDRSPLSLLHSGHSPYAMPVAPRATGVYRPTMPLNVDFVPSQKPASEIEQPERDSETDNPPARPEAATGAEVEDTFENEADKMSEEADEEVGGFNSLKSGMEISPVKLPSVFLPASHGK